MAVSPQFHVPLSQHQIARLLKQSSRLSPPPFLTFLLLLFQGVQLQPQIFFRCLMRKMPQSIQSAAAPSLDSASICKNRREEYLSSPLHPRDPRLWLAETCLQGFG